MKPQSADHESLTAGAVLRPPRLQPGAGIGVIAPASPMAPENLEKGISYLEKAGYRMVRGQTLTLRRGYLAGEDRARAEDLMSMFQRPDVDAIFCVRGGYGTPRLLRLLDYDLIRRHPKILLGYSDITALQLAIFRRTGLVTFSGPMVAVEMANGILPQTEAALWRVLTDAETAVEFAPLQASSFESWNLREARGPLLGGCLSLVAAVLGTPFAPDFTGAVLLLEDVGEAPYRIDGYLAALKNAGVLESIAAAVIGRFEDCVPEEGKPSLELREVLEDYFLPLNIPVLLNIDYGHGKLKHTFPIGLPVRIDADPPRLMAEMPAVVEA